MSRKLSDWQARLSDYIVAAANMPFSYNRAMGLDCCTFTWGAIHAQTGIAVGEQFAGTYSTRKEALDCMKRYCGRPSLSLSIAKLMKEHGFQTTTWTYAQRGDAILSPKPNGGEFLGVMDLNGRDIISVGDGLRRVPVSIRCRAWRVA